MSTPQHLPSGPGRGRRIWPLALALGLVGLLAAGAAGVWIVPSSEERYLDALEEQGLDDAFESEEDAIRTARRRCDDLDAGRQTAGSEAERLGVEHLCAEHADEFERLESGEFDGALLVMSLGEGSVDTTGESCSGADGYEDIHADAPVVVSDPEGNELARTTLGRGEAPDEDSCVFGFTVELTEGSGRYEVSLGEHHLQTLTWEGLHDPGALSFVVGGVD